MNPDAALRADVARAVAAAPVTDIHTHLYDPAIAPRLLWGPDALLTYHYLAAETLRARPDLDAPSFFALDARARADRVWEELFVRRAPLSEACRGVLTVFQALGLDGNARTLAEARAACAGLTARAYADRVFRLAGVERVVMTNDPLDEVERGYWERGFERDPRFLAALRLDGILKDWPRGVPALRALGCEADSSVSGATLDAVRRFLEAWRRRLDARYLAISLPPSFRFPDPLSSLDSLLAKAVAPVAREAGLPVALMLGVRKGVNPALGDAGDSVGVADIESVERLAAAFPDVRFLVTVLARDNMHGLCVAARKFANLVPFGCWWFLNNPSLIREQTAMRFEMLGLSFVPQHSDSRVLDQLLYKWAHSRTVLGDVLADQYDALSRAGWRVDRAGLARDVRRLFDGSLAGLARPAPARRPADA